MVNKCRGSGIILGGYRDELADLSFKTRCVECWRMVDEVPVEPEPRTDLRTDGSVVMVNRKQIVDHEFGSICAMRLRRDGHKWLLLVSLAMIVTGIVGFILDLVWF